MRNSGRVQGTQQDQSTHTQDERQDLCLEDGTPKSICIGNYRILFLEEKLLQEREFCTLQVVMDANNFNVLWTEASWVGNKTLTPYSPNQRNRLYLERTPSNTHNLILLKGNEPIFLFQTRKKRNTKQLSQQLALETHGVSSVLSQGGWLQVLSES